MELALQEYGLDAYLPEGFVDLTETEVDIDDEVFSLMERHGITEETPVDTD